MEPEIKDLQNFLNKISPKEPIAFMSLILNAKAISLENNVLTLSYANTQTYQMKQIRNNVQKLKDLFSSEMNLTVDFAFKVREL